MLKVILTSRWVHPNFKGGMEKYISYLARELSNLDIKVRVVSSGRCFQAANVRENLELVFLPPIVTRPITITNYLFSISLARYLKGQEFDVLHSFETSSFTYLLKSRERRRPTITHALGFEPVTVEYLFNPLERVVNIPMGCMLRYCVRTADCLVTLGKSYTRFAERAFGVPQDRIFELPNGIPLDLIRQIANNPILTRKMLGLDLDEFVMIGVGRLIPLKGFEYLIKALSITSQTIGDLKLLLVGTGPLEGTIRSLIEKMGLNRVVIHLKNVTEKELYSLYGISDLAVLPLLDISGPDLTVLESMAAGLPVVTTDIWENASVVKHGVNGYLVPPRDYAALAEAIIEAYIHRDKLHKMGRTSQDIVAQYDWSNVAMKAIKLYSRLIR